MNTSEILSDSDLRPMMRKLARLVEVSLTLNSTLDPDRVLLSIIQTAAELLDCEAASILLYDEKHGELNFISAVGSDSKKLAQIPVPIEGSIAGTIFRENRPLLINDVEKDPRHFTQVGAQVNFQPHAILGVPMRIQDRATGVLEALNKRQGDFDQDDVRLLSVIASQAAVAIRNARLVQALQCAYDDLSRIDKLKSDFISIASHELRTPLGVILGYATFLQEEAQGEMSEHATVVLNSAMRLKSIVEAMTNMDLLQIRSVELRMQKVVLQNLVTSVSQEIAPSMETKGHQVTVNFPKAPIEIQADPEKLGLAIKNILNNACRFTPDGGKISISGCVSKGKARLEIADNGLGIPKNELENIFKEFYQVEDHMTRRFGGLGLGLAIARGLIELHQGRVWAESEGTGQGSTFIVTLPQS